MNVALVYDRVNKWGGAERVLLALHELFPDAPLFTTVYDKEHAPWASVFDVRTSFLQHIPFAKNNHELFPFLSSIAFEQFDFDGFDMVISVTSAEAKGIITKPGTLHICYCLTPTRYLWSHYWDYFRPGLFQRITLPIVSSMREWDIVASSRPDHYVTISSTVKERVKKYYKLDSAVIYPPVTIGSVELSRPTYQIPYTKYFLIVSRLVGYKKIDIAVKAFNELNLPLVIVGSGREEGKLRRMAYTNISFVKDLTDEELSCYYQKSRAFVMVQEEDFGISAVEAQMHGIPVIAYKKGGAIDTVISGKTGIFFEEQTKSSLKNAIIKFQTLEFKKEECWKQAEKFSKEKFQKEISEYIRIKCRSIKKILNS
jgi:glycosyltransferase involved in cell wall biosynthesis